MYYRKADLHFECTGCGRCCFGSPSEHYIEVSMTEIRAIRRHLGLSAQVFEERYVLLLPDDTASIRITRAGRCALLDENNRCSVYPVRPRQCRTYPFWPELVTRKKDWQAEARRCEGINRGPVVALARIESCLAGSADSD